MSAESAAFYATAAQVLPVLFLAIIFEQRILRRDESRPESPPDFAPYGQLWPSVVFGIETGRYPRGRFGIAFATLVVLFPIDLFIGEWLALAAVNGREADVAGYFVTGALLIAGVLVILPPVWLAVPMVVPRTAMGGKLGYGLGRWVIVALAIGCGTFTTLGVILAIA